MQCLQIQNDDDLKKFTEIFTLQSKEDSFPFQMLRLCSVYVVYKDGEMISGCAVREGNNIDEADPKYPTESFSAIHPSILFEIDKLWFHNKIDDDLWLGASHLLLKMIVKNHEHIPVFLLPEPPSRTRDLFILLASDSLGNPNLAAPLLRSRRYKLHFFKQIYSSRVLRKWFMSRGDQYDKSQNQKSIAERSIFDANLILEGENIIRDKEGFVGYWPVVLLGSGDVVGLITVSLKQRGRRPYILGRGDTLPLELLGRKCIVIDVSDQGAIEEYADKFWKGVIVLSKSRSPPSHKTTAQLKSRSILMYFVTQRKLSIVNFFDSDSALTYPNGAKKSNAMIRKFG